MKIIFAVTELLADKQLPEDNVRNCFCDNSTIYRRIPNLTGNVLFIVCQKCIGIACSGNIVLRYQSVQRLLNFQACGNLIRANVLSHKNTNIFHIRFHVVHIAYQVQQLQNIDIVWFNAVMMIGSVLTTINDTANRTFQKGVNSVIKQIERHQCIFILVLDRLCCLLKTGKHRALTAGKMLSGISVFPDLCKHILHQPELIRHKGICFYKFTLAGITFQIQYRTAKGKQIFQYLLIFFVLLPEQLFCGFCFGKNTLFDDFVHRGRTQTQPGVETSLYFREIVSADLGNAVNCLLRGHHDPHSAAALCTDLFHNRLQIQHEIRIRTDVLTNFIDHKQQPVVLALTLYIFFNFLDKLLNTQLNLFFPVKPVACRSFTHVQCFRHCCYNVILKKSKGLTRILP